MTKPPIPPESRTVLLERAALDAARSWAGAFCGALANEGRAVEGGWPGTIREARARAAAEATRVLSGMLMTPLTHTEIEQLARTANEEARRVWMRSTRVKRHG